MKKRIISAIAITAILTVAVTIGALAATGAIQITATLDPGITIKFDGETKALTDANGAAVYPILYNGTTYVPVRAVAGLFSTPVDWDGNTRSVLLGKGAVKETKLSDLTASSKSGSQDRYIRDVLKDRFGNVYRDCVNLNTQSHEIYVEYFLDKQYSKLTLIIVPEENFSDSKETVISIDGDSKNLWTSGKLDYKSRPETIEIDVTGQEYIRFSATMAWDNNCYIILGNATLS